MDATTGAVGALVKYLYTDAVDNDDITEDLIALASKYNLVQLKVINRLYQTCETTRGENYPSRNLNFSKILLDVKKTLVLNKCR